MDINVIFDVLCTTQNSFTIYLTIFISTQQNEAVAAILANRSKIAGSDSESDSDDSDSDYTDDGY